MPRGRTHTEPAPAPGRAQPTVVVATEVLLLWPRGVGRQVTRVEEAGLWPVFVVVVGERDDLDTGSARALFDLLDQPKHVNEVTVVTGRCQWSVLDPKNALLRFAVHASAPVRFDTEIIIPAAPVVGILDVVASGATIGITTRRHAGRLTGRVDIRDALREVVLLSCPASPELAGLADWLCWTR